MDGEADTELVLAIDEVMEGEGDTLEEKELLLVPVFEPESVYVIVPTVVSLGVFV